MNARLFPCECPSNPMCEHRLADQVLAQNPIVREVIKSRLEFDERRYESAFARSLRLCKERDEAREMADHFGIEASENSASRDNWRFAAECARSWSARWKQAAKGHRRWEERHSAEVHRVTKERDEAREMYEAAEARHLAAIDPMYRAKEELARAQEENARLLEALLAAVDHVDASAFKENVPWLKQARAALSFAAKEPTDE